MSQSTLFGVVTLTVIFVLFLYSIGGAFFEAKHIHIIHETGLGILLGVLAGFMFTIFYPDSIDSISDFNTEFFFYVLLPVIIFSGGYNLNKKRFFQNFLYINLFGLFGTIICFLFIVICTFYVNKWGFIKVWNNYEKEVDLNIYQIMIFSATICATDSVAGLTMIKPEKHPKLFSVVFGEGMVNDAVSIIIFLAVGDLAGNNGKSLNFEWYTVFQLIGQFLKDFVLSLLIGAFLGLFGTWLFKSLRFLTHSCVLETAIILYVGYVSFTICELTNLSGVLSVLVTGIVLAHYNFYNISPIGKISSQVTIQTMSLVCESAIYVYLGLSIWTLRGTNGKPGKVWSWTFVLCELVVCLLGRGISMAFLSLLMIGIKGRKSWRLSFWELSIIWFAGLIRGSIAYALISQLHPTSDDTGQIDLLQNTILIMVIATTVILGGLMPCYINVNLRHDQANKLGNKFQKDRSTIRDTLVGQIDLAGESPASKRYRTRFQKIVKRLDDHYVKPFLIFNYNARKNEIARSKKMLKMNNANFDPTQFGRMTLMNHQSGAFPGNHVNEGASRASQKYQSGGQGERERQSLLTKITIRSSFNSKFMGNQQFAFDLDVPLYADEYESNKGSVSDDVVIEEENEESEVDEGRSSVDRREKEISISKIMPKDSK